MSHILDTSELIDVIESTNEATSGSKRIIEWVKKYSKKIGDMINNIIRIINQMISNTINAIKSKFIKNPDRKVKISKTLNDFTINKSISFEKIINIINNTLELKNLSEIDRLDDNGKKEKIIFINKNVAKVTDEVGKLFSCPTGTNFNEFIKNKYFNLSEEKTEITVKELFDKINSFKMMSNDLRQTEKEINRELSAQIRTIERLKGDTNTINITQSYTAIIMKCINMLLRDINAQKETLMQLISIAKHAMKTNSSDNNNTNSDFKPLSYLEKAVKDENVKDLRIAIRSYIKKCLGDKKEILQAVAYVKSNISEELYSKLWEKIDKEPMESDSSKWDKDYFAQLQGDLRYNFAKERFNHILLVGEKVYGSSK